MDAAVLQKNLSRKGLWLLLSLGLLVALARPAQAEDSDPPTRAGRVAEVIGDAWLFDTETKEWTRVMRNQTIGEGDRLRTDERSRVGLRIGSTSIWLDERSDLEFSRLDEGQVLLNLDKGDVGLRLRAQEVAADYRVQTREGLVFPEREGLYRVEQLDRGSRAYAWQGTLRFESSRGAGVTPVWLQGGEQAEFWWADGPRAERQRIEGDSFGDWMLAQSRSEGGLPSHGYVSPEMTGAEDLDRHGRWEQAEDYGNVWIPNQVAVDWVPYRDGRWAWTRHWGWTWVDDSPWGFAPFHYGRWVTWRGRWCWAPGRYVARPVYAPALVAWVGGGSVSIGIGIGGGRPAPPRYGWYPLAPREAYVPHYRHSPRYGHRVNEDLVGPPRPPRHNRDVVGAISYLPGQGERARPLPPSNDWRQVPGAPGRGDLSGLQPQRPTVEPQRPGADMPWRSERRRERGGEREPYRPQPVTTAPPQQQLPQWQQQAPQRPAEQPWRGRDRLREQPAEQQPAPAEVRIPGQQQELRGARPEPQAPRAFERPNERPRGVEPTVVPQPRPAPEVRAPQPRSENKEEPRRGRPGNSERGREAER